MSGGINGRKGVWGDSQIGERKKGLLLLLDFTIALLGKQQQYQHFADEETKDQKDSMTFPLLHADKNDYYPGHFLKFSMPQGSTRKETEKRKQHLKMYS